MSWICSVTPHSFYCFVFLVSLEVSLFFPSSSLFVSHDSPTGINELMLEVGKTNLLSLNKDAGHLRKLQKSKFLLNNV